MPAVRGGMGNNSSAIAGEGKVFGINQPKSDGRENSKDGKDFLQRGFWIVSARFSIYDIINDISGGNCGWILRFNQFSIRTNSFFGFLPFFPAGRSALCE